MSRKKNEAAASKEETLPQSAERSNTPNCESLDNTVL